MITGVPVCFSTPKATSAVISAATLLGHVTHASRSRRARRNTRASARATALQGHFNDRSLNAEVFEMAGRIGIDCLTIELADVVPVLKQQGLI